MRRRRLHRAGAAVLALIIGACGSRAPRSAQPRAELGPHAPAELAATPPAGGAPAAAVVRVRVYADTDYRAQEIDWEQEVAARLERASEVLEPTCGLRLELERTVIWERSGGDDLDAVLTELEIRDPAGEVDLVLGLVDSLDEPAAELDRLGASRPLGRHIALRNLSALAERDALVAAHPEWPEAARAELAAAHRQHKETVLLLQELGQLLAAPPATDERALMSSRYSAAQSAFAPATAALLLEVAGPWARRDAEAARAVAREALSSPQPDWDEAGRSERFAWASRPPGQEWGWKLPPVGDGVRPADRQAYGEALELAAAGSFAAAWTRLEPLVEFHPGDAAIALLACRGAVGRGSDRAPALCERAAEVSGRHLWAVFYGGQALRAAGQQAEALAAFDEVAAALDRLALADDAAAWRALAGAYREARRVSDAERAAAEAEDGEVLAWARRTRARFALAPDAGIARADEPAYIEGMEQALKSLYAGKVAAARAGREQLARHFGGAPGVAVLDCELAFRQRDFRGADRACRRALEGYADASWPQYLLGLLAQRTKDVAEAIRRFEAALARDPELEHAYQVLAELYQGRDRAALAELRRRYREHFGKPLAARP